MIELIILNFLLQILVGLTAPEDDVCAKCNKRHRPDHVVNKQARVFHREKNTEQYKYKPVILEIMLDTRVNTNTYKYQWPANEPVGDEA